LHAESQQTPSTQKPFEQSALPLQVLKPVLETIGGLVSSGTAASNTVAVSATAVSATKVSATLVSGVPVSAGPVSAGPVSGAPVSTAESVPASAGVGPHTPVDALQLLPLVQSALVEQLDLHASPPQT
jgi:hypothetical protein